MSDAKLGSALLEVAALGRAVGGRGRQVSVLSCAAAAGTVQPLCRAEGIPLVGGGGTDLREGFATVLATRPRPDVVVVLTDRQTPSPDQQPPGATVVGFFPRQRSLDAAYVPDPPPEWDRVVTIG